MGSGRGMHETTVNLRPDVWLRLRNRADRDDVTLSALANDLLVEALTSSSSGPTSIGAGDAEIRDLGANATKHLRAGMT